MSKLVRVGFALLAVVLARSAPAQDAGEAVEVHGFGGWAAGKSSSPNVYLAGRPDLEYRQTDLNLNVTANVSDHLRIVGQTAFTESADGNAVDLSYAFAEWKFRDSLMLRAGQVKQPFGISNEVFAVGTLRPFYALPQAVYGPVGLVSDSYKGIGLTGSHAAGRGRLRYDLYAGGIDLEEYGAPEQLLRGESVSASTLTEDESTRNVVGGSVVFETPVDGLSFGASGYTGSEIGSNHRWVAGVHAECHRGPWSLRSEYAHETVKDDLVVDGFYAEASYRLDARWQAAAQYGYLTTELPGADVTPAPSLLDHKEVALGLDYWFSPSFVLKLSYHHVDGNRFAGPLPDDYAVLIPAGRLDSKTDLVQFGAQFSF
jgi:Phosphate-selective porin O and P